MLDTVVLVLLTGSASAFPYPTECGHTHFRLNVVTLILDYHYSYHCDHHLSINLIMSFIILLIVIILLRHKLY